MASLNLFAGFRAQKVIEENNEDAESVPVADVEVAEDDATALLRYLKKQGKLSQEKANDNPNINKGDEKNKEARDKTTEKTLPIGAAADEDQQVIERKTSVEENSKLNDGGKEEENEALRKKKEEEDEKNSLLKYMSQRGVVLRPPVAQAIAIPAGDTPDSSTKKVEGRFSLGVGGIDQVPTAELLREALEELNEASFPLKYVLGEENGRNLREEICAEPKKFLRDHRPGIRLVARAAQRFFSLEAQLKQEEIDKKWREQELEAARERTRKQDLKREKAWRKQDAALSKAKVKGNPDKSDVASGGGVSGGGSGGGVIGEGEGRGGGGEGGSASDNNIKIPSGKGSSDGISARKDGTSIIGRTGKGKDSSQESESGSSSDEEGGGLTAISKFVGGS